MNYSKYASLDISPDKSVFYFISTGPKGDFKIEVQFTAIQGMDLFNLGFGVMTDSGEIDDVITLNNNDRDKILATIAGFADEFLQNRPSAIIFFSGSTLSRTRLYRRAISINYSELKKKFEILGIRPGNHSNVEHFNPTVNYEAFLVRRIIFDS